MERGRNPAETGAGTAGARAKRRATRWRGVGYARGGAGE